MQIISREDAAAQGLPTYFTGRPCPRGHIAPRHLHSRGCVECEKEYRRRRYAADPAYAATMIRRATGWATANRARYLKRLKKWRAENPERAKELIARWKLDNPERNAAIDRAKDIRRKTRKRGNGGTITADEIEQLHRQQRGRCAGCSKRSKRLEIDHILAVARGGRTDKRNSQLLCRRCNRTKSAKDAIAWAQENGRLL